MTEGLTPRDFQILEAPFPDAETGMKGKHIYIKRSAIMRRIRLVDPGYTMKNDTYVQINGDVVTVWGELTIKGVTHHDSCSKNVEAWRKQDNGDYTRVNEYEYSRELANAIMKAQTGLLHRCASRFGLGVYLLEKSNPPSLASVLGEQPKPTNVTPLPTPPPAASEPPPQPQPSRLGQSPKKQAWTINGGVPLFEKRMNELGLRFADIATELEPGRTLLAVIDISLPLDETLKRLLGIAEAKKDKPSGESL